MQVNSFPGFFLMFQHLHPPSSSSNSLRFYTPTPIFNSRSPNLFSALSMSPRPYLLSSIDLPSLSHSHISIMRLNSRLLTPLSLLISTSSDHRLPFQSLLLYSPSAILFYPQIRAVCSETLYDACSSLLWSACLCVFVACCVLGGAVCLPV
jgi:hypothetical protein